MEFKINTSIPISFEKTDIELADNRFTPVVIYLCHTNENLNGSFFDKSVIESMIPTLSNVPLLGYITVDNFDESDFKGHEQRLVLEDGDITIEYLGRAYGLIPESHNARFEMKICEDGVEREFLVCDGLLWNKFKECIDIFDRDSVKSQSMELQPDSINGYFGKDKLFHFTSAAFEAACILGEGIIPAMTGSTVEKFSYSDIKNDISEMIKEYNVFSNSQQFLQHNDIEVAEESQESKEGGNKIVPENIVELLQKYSLTENDLIEKGITYTEFSVEDLETKINETFQKDKVKTEEVTSQFSLTSEQMESELRRELAEIETLTEVWYDEVYTSPRYYYRDHKPDQSIVIAMDEKNWSLVGASFSVVGDAVEIDSSTIVRYKIDYNPMNLSGEDVENDDITVDPEELSDEDDMFSAFTSKAKAEFMVQAKEKSLTKKFEVEKESAISETNAKFAELQVKFDELQAKYALTDSELATKLQAEREASETTIFESFSKSLTEEEMADVKAKKADFSLQEIEDKLCVILGRKAKVAPVANFSKVEEPAKPLRYSIVSETAKQQSDKSYADLIKTKE